MELERRKFLRSVVRAGSLLAASLLWCFERVTPLRCVEAVRVKRYPGPLKKARPTTIAGPGKWAG